MEIQTTVGALDGARKRIKFAGTIRSALPVLRAIVISADKHGCFAATSDMEVSALTAFEGKHKGSGEVLIDMPELAKLCSGNGKATDVFIRTVRDKVAVRVGNLDKVVTSWPRADYPDVIPGDFPADECAAFDGEELRRMLRQVVPAASPDLTRPILNCVNIRPEGEGIELAATDSYRLHVTRGKANFDPLLEAFAGTKDWPGVNIPARVLKPVAMGKDEEVDIAILDGFAHIYADGVYTKVRLTEGMYPNWKQLVHNGDATVSWTGVRDEWFKGAVAIDRVVTKNAPMRVLHHDKLPHNDLLWCFDQESGETTVPVKRTNTLIEPADVGYQAGFNPRFFADALSCFAPGEVAFEQKNSLCPLQMRQWNSDASELLILLMPVRIGDLGNEVNDGNLPESLRTVAKPKRERKPKMVKVVAETVVS